MKSTKKGIVLALCLAFAGSGSAIAEPSYLIYPANVPTIFRYDTARYEVLAPGHDKFDPLYAIGNFMLWDRVEQRVPVEIYGAPDLIGFEPTFGTSEYIVYFSEFDLVIDGFGPGPRTIANLCLRFWPYATVTPLITVDDASATALTFPLPALHVETPGDDGMYTGTRSHHVSWLGAVPMEIVAFSDKDGDGAYQGTPAFRIVSRQSPVATQPSSWGRVKALYRP